MKNLIEKMRKLVDLHVESYKTDFDHDLNFIDKNEGFKFVWILREMGTNIVRFHTEVSLPSPGESVKYLFGHADRSHIVKGEFESLKECFKDARAVYLVDLKSEKLVEADLEKAISELGDYNRNILRIDV